MPFHFSLETLLHLRRSLERQQELLLRAANHRATRIRHRILQLHADSVALRGERDRGLEAGTTSAEIRFFLQRVASIEDQQRVLAADLVKLEKICDQQQKALQQARREREVLESLRDRQLRSHRHAADRRQQRNLDELFLLQRVHRRR